MVNKKVQRIKFIIAVMVVVAAAILVAVRISVYNKNGEKDMPYVISKIMIVSTANKDTALEEQPVEGTESVWNFNIIQNNDVYIEISNRNAKKDEKIEKVSIEDIQIVEAPKKGTLKVYMPNNVDGDRYTYLDEHEVKESLTYGKDDESSFKDLRINKNGGIVSFSFANKDIGKYSSGNDTEVTFDGKLLSKLSLTDEDFKSKVAFTIVIELDDGKKYSGRIEAEINCDGMIENGKAQTEITDFSNVVFKRI